MFSQASVCSQGEGSHVTIIHDALDLTVQGVPVFWEVKTQSAKICLKFNLGWGRVFWEVKTQSAKICLNLNFQGWGGGGEGGVLGSQNLKYQDLPKFQLGGGVFWEVKT